jgi:hypothetical protein
MGKNNIVFIFGVTQKPHGLNLLMAVSRAFGESGDIKLKQTGVALIVYEIRDKEVLLQLCVVPFSSSSCYIGIKQFEFEYWVELLKWDRAQECRHP